jgi:alpha-tubulin suppressor-like RCC1 family protein
VVAVLSAAACRDDQIVGPSDRKSADAGPGIAATATALAFAQVSAGASHTCGLTTGGQLYCWGSNLQGQLGDGTTESHASPTLVAGGLLFRHVSAGEGHTCAVTTGNRAYCWGVNESGQLGNGELGGDDDGVPHKQVTPAPVVTSRAFRQISAGLTMTCALTTSATNKIYCWGTGILGNGSGSSQHTTPQLVSGARTYREVAVGRYHICALSTTYEVLCWGWNNLGQLGSASPSSFTAVTPVPVAGRLQFLQVSAGFWHTCAVTTTAKAYCWGYGKDGQIGDGTLSKRYVPRAVAGGLSFDRVSAGAVHTCGRTTGKRAYCWGDNQGGLLGDGTYTQRLTPTPVSGGLVFKQVDTGANHACGVATGSLAMWCWGNGFTGPSPVQ